MFLDIPGLSSFYSDQQPGNCGPLENLWDDSDRIQQVNQLINRKLNSLISGSGQTGYLAVERKLASFLHWQSYCYLKKLETIPIDNRLTWDNLKEQLSQASGSDSSSILTITWLNYLRTSSSRLNSYFNTPYTGNTYTEDPGKRYVIHQNALLTPGQASMWHHCQIRFNRKSDLWQVVLETGFESPASQFLQFSSSNPALGLAIKSNPPPGLSGHSLPIPHIRVRLVDNQEISESPPWTLLYETCSEFGFDAAYSDSTNLKGELRFAGIEELYNEIFLNPLIPVNIARDLPPALQEAGFYPSPRGLRTILALSAQESTIQWNPKLNLQKKRYLGERFHHLLGKLKKSVPGSVSTLFLSAEHKKQLDHLFKELNELTDPTRDRAREYDFYLWSRKALLLIDELFQSYKKMARIGQWFFDLKKLKSKLEFEPQTFGLWQINVNHLKEKIESYRQLRRAYPEIYQLSNGTWQVNRSWLIDALSGIREARLSRRRTLELIIHTHLRPRYENHLLGDDEDLLYFSAENMAGEMSTFRAAIQERLNNKMNTRLVTDGDLTYYLAYSMRVDWERPSKSYRVLRDFVDRHQYYFSPALVPDKEVAKVCRASSWNDLTKLELYKKLMGNKSPPRVFPGIKSALYDQTPLDYARLVRKKSMLF